MRDSFYAIGQLDTKKLENAKAYQETMALHHFAPSSEQNWISLTKSNTTQHLCNSTWSYALKQSCDVNGVKGDGTSRGSCPQSMICQANGDCTPKCNVNGKPGNGTKRGSCKINEICWNDGACYPGIYGKDFLVLV